jgi:Protein of unknown function (DUF3761)
MKTLALSLLVVGAIGATAVFAAVPAGAPAGTMGLCNDGTYSTSAEKKGACHGHKGVKEWYGESTAASAPTGTSQRPATPAPTTATAPTTAKSAAPAVAGGTAAAPAAPAPGGGAGKVWANTSTKVYHCPGTKYYGTTKQGEYMSESDAKSKGYHADHGKACA